jgi:hypothetical protein
MSVDCSCFPTLIDVNGDAAFVRCSGLRKWLSCLVYRVQIALVLSLCEVVADEDW